MKFRAHKTTRGIAAHVVALIEDEGDGYYANPRGAIEQAATEASNGAHMLGRLIETLHAKGVLADADVLSILKQSEYDLVKEEK